MPLSFPVLKVVSEARNAHGLRLQDPARYNSYCTKRISTLKRSLKFIQKSKKSPPKPVTLELVQQDSRYLEIVLFSAERAWSQSASFKSNEEQYGKRKHHIARRLKKAISHAEKLSSLLDSELLSADPSTRLEVRAYKSTLTGQSAFESKHWETALKAYSTAKIILEVLLSKSDETSRPVYKEALTAVDPGLRYCGYQLQINTSEGDVFSLAQGHFVKDEELMGLLREVNPEILDKRRESSTRAGITSVEWRGRRAALKHPEIVVALLNVQDTQAAFHERTTTFELSAQEKLAAMDEILNAWAETETEVQRLIDDEVTVKQDKEQNLHIILTYVSYHFIATRVQRDVLLAKDLQRKRNTMTVLKDLVRLHDSIIQSIRQIYELPGVAADTELTDSLDAKQSYFKASRCVLIARSHMLLKDDVAALALYDRAQTYISKLPSSPSSITQDIPVTKDDISSLAKSMHSEMTHVHAQVILSDPSGTESATKTSALMSLHRYPQPKSLDLTNLVEFPVKLRPVPVKPYFFDIAYNYFGLEDAVEEKKNQVVPPGKEEKKQPEQPAKKGWFWR